MEPAIGLLTVYVVARVVNMATPDYVPNSCVNCKHDNPKGSEWCEKCGAGMKAYNNSEVAEKRVASQKKLERDVDRANRQIKIDSEKEKEKTEKKIQKNVERKRKQIEKIRWCNSCEKEVKPSASYCSDCGSKLGRLPDSEIDARLIKFRNSFWAKI